MADVFTSLAEQTLGLSTAVQPLAASRFGPTPTIAADMPFRFADEQGHFLPPALVEEAAASEASDLPLPLISPDDPRVAAPLPTFQQMVQSVVAAQDEPGPDVIQPHNASVAHLSAARAESVTLPDAPPHGMFVEAILQRTHPADNLPVSQTIMEASATPSTYPQPQAASALETPDNNIRRDAGHASDSSDTAVPLPPDRSIASPRSPVEAQAERVVQPAIPKSAAPPANLPSVSPVSPAISNIVQLQAAPASVTADTPSSQLQATSVAVVQPNGLADDLPVSPSVNQAKVAPSTDLKSNAPPAIHAPRNSRRRTAAPADMASEPTARHQPVAPTLKPLALTATDLQAETMVQVGGQIVAARIVPLAHETRTEVEAQADRVVQPALPKSAAPPAYLPSVSPVSPAIGNVVQLQAAPASVTPDTPSSQAHATRVGVTQPNGLTGELPVSPLANQSIATPSTDLKSKAPPAIQSQSNPRRRTAAPGDMAPAPTLKPPDLTAADLQAATMVQVAGQTVAARIVPLARETRTEVEAQAERVVQPAIPKGAAPPAHLPLESPAPPAIGKAVQSQTTLADIAPGALASLAQTISSTQPPRATATPLQQNAKSSQEDEEPIAPRLDPAALPSSARSQSMTAGRLPPVVSETLPTIRVTIGRIEVRTTPAPSTPAVRQARPAQPALSLKEYLKQGQSKKS